VKTSTEENKDSEASKGKLFWETAPVARLKFSVMYAPVNEFSKIA
jgi:hypothetical protein